MHLQSRVVVQVIITDPIDFCPSRYRRHHHGLILFYVLFWLFWYWNLHVEDKVNQVLIFHTAPDVRYRMNMTWDQAQF